METMFQKTGDYCFIACVASTLLEPGNEYLLKKICYDHTQVDENYNRLQDLILDTFPVQLQKGGTQPSVPARF